MRGVWAGALLLWAGASGAAPPAGTGRQAAPRAAVDPDPEKRWGAPLAAGERRITILGTNDLHGGLESSPPSSRGGPRLGGMALWSGVVAAIRRGVAARDGDRGGVVLVDAGDQFQGTLVSNIDEGKTVIAAMMRVGRVGTQVGYDAIVPGNHDYDFGPLGWKVDEAQTAAERRGALEARVQQLSAGGVSFISANTFLRESIRYVDASAQQQAAPATVPVGGILCQPAGSAGRGGDAVAPVAAIDFARARRPPFVQPFVVRTVAGVRVALVGLDNPYTPTTTTPKNVEDLCFADLFDSYRAVVGQAGAGGGAPIDVWVAVMHDGNTSNERPVARFVEKVRAVGLPLHAIVSGHTHAAYAETIDGIPVIQSGSGGRAFGRIDLTWDSARRQVIAEKTKLAGGVQLVEGACDADFAAGFCRVAAGQVTYDGVVVAPDADVAALVQQSRRAIVQVEPLAESKMGVVEGTLWPHRIDESPLANAISDGLRLAAGADIAMVNTGGLRAPIRPRTAQGEFFFEDLFTVLPFGNRGVMLELDGETLMALLLRSVQTCGNYGALMQSGLRVEFSRDCAALPPGQGGVDRAAKLLRVRTVSGETLLDAQAGIRPAPGRRFKVVTLDFLAAGGAGYSDFARGKKLAQLDIVRDLLARTFVAKNVRWSGQVDGRWLQVNAPAQAGKAPPTASEN